MSEEIPMDTLAAVYLKIRDRINKITREMESEIEALKVQQETIANEMRTRMRAENATSVKTGAGTVIMTVKTRYYPSDWETFSRFVKENDELDLLERRVAQGNIATYIKEHPDTPPPGLNSSSEYAISVRKVNK